MLYELCKSDEIETWATQPVATGLLTKSVAV